MCKVTVVMNFYNEEKYLAQAIESILNQTYKDFELLLVDDASTDNSNDIANSYNDARVRVIRNETNRGPAYSRNVGMREAKGEYVAFADGDDYFAINRIELETDFLDKHRDVLGVSCWSNYIDENGKMLEAAPFILLNKDEVRASFLFGNLFCNPGSMIRRSVFEKYGIFQAEELRVSQDYYFWLKILEVGELQIIPEKLIFYRVHNSKSSQNVNKDKKQYDALMKKLLCYAWKSYSFEMEEGEICFIYNYFFKQNAIWKISELVNTYKLWKKMCCQMSNFSAENRVAIKKIFMKRLRKLVIYLHPVRCVKNRMNSVLCKK